MKQEDWALEIIEALEELQLFQVERPYPTFKIHPLYQVGTTVKSKENIKHIFGKAWFTRTKQRVRNLRKRNSFIFTAPLPKDSVIFFRPNKQGIIIASLEQRQVLKIFLDESFKYLLDEEVNFLNRIQSTSFSQYTTKLIAEGTSSNGARWLLSEYRSNIHSLKNRPQKDKYILENLYSLLMPAMTEFYKLHSPKVLKLEDWVKHAQKRVQQHPSKEKLQLIIHAIQAESRAFEVYEVIESCIHLDLHAGNILLSEQNLTIIDWEGVLRALTIIDIFDFSRRYIASRAMIKRVFWKFIQKKSSQLPELLKTSFEEYRDWAKENFGAVVPAESARITYFIYALERSLLLYELRAVDRLKDRQGFEFLVSEAIK